ncbi:MAG: radical SAM protein [Candidatus Micrarchaeota archaeon]
MERKGICFTRRLPPFEIKARLLCSGARVDAEAKELFERQNPSRVKRGGLSSGGKIRLDRGLFVNFPFYERRETPLTVLKEPNRELGVLISENGNPIASAEVLMPPAWYNEEVEGFPITRIFTAHNRQLATAVYEDCALFYTGEQCRFCAINRSLSDKDPKLVRKSGDLLVAALDKIPVRDYGGITLNGGMTLTPARGMEVLAPVVERIRKSYPEIPIAVEITPPQGLDWIDWLAASGASSLMMNLETWDSVLRSKLLPGKDGYCPREQYLYAFERALKVFGPGKISTCFVVGTEPMESLREGISKVVSMGVVPSPLAGRYFEDIPDYPFVPDVDWKDFLDIVLYAASEMRKAGKSIADKAGCVACGMCDLVRDAFFS